MKLPLKHDFTDKVVVITGAGGVLCGVMARAYAQAGAKVAALDLNEEAVRKLADELKEKNPEIVIVTNELGYGVVPVSAFDRRYREDTGRICCKLAAEAEEVWRVYCGIGTCIKGEKS